MKMKTAILIITAIALAVGFALFQISKSRKAATTAAQPSVSNNACLLGQGGCANQAQENTGVASLTSNELASMLLKKDFFFVNVHVPYEGEIKGTDAFIPYNEIGNSPDELPKDKNAKIVLYCRSGRMSGIAKEMLAKLGYTNVSDLAGGMLDWEKNGYEIVKK